MLNSLTRDRANLVRLRMLAPLRSQTRILVNLLLNILRNSHEFR